MLEKATRLQRQLDSGSSWVAIIELGFPMLLLQARSNNDFGEESGSMSRMSLKELVPPIALSLLVAVGYGAGSFLRLAECSLLAALACLAGAILAVVAWCRRSPTVVEKLAAVGLIAYLVAAVAFDALLFTQDEKEVFVSIAWLCPLVVGGALLPQRGAWVAAAGCWAVLFAGVVALAYNVSHVESGVGFLERWVY